jgi:hypothetical protein
VEQTELLCELTFHRERSKFLIKRLKVSKMGVDACPTRTPVVACVEVNP